MFITEIGVAHLAEGCKTLQKLNVCCCSVDVLGFAALARNCLDLATLKFDRFGLQSPKSYNNDHPQQVQTLRESLGLPFKEEDIFGGLLCYKWKGHVEALFPPHVKIEC
jgi:hypothetical protein